MWKTIKWVIVLACWAFMALFLYYTLPRHDIGRITSSYTKRVDFGENRWFYSHAGAGDKEGMASRDVFFIAAILENGKPMEYRNEDTAWSWPPYFKFNSSNLQTRAADLVSTEEEPKWVAIRHYGVRSNLYSVYPNALKMWRVDGPEVRIIPWFDIIFLTLLAAVVWGVWVRWRRFRRNRIDPVLEDWSDSLAEAGDTLDRKRGRFRNWLSGLGN